MTLFENISAPASRKRFGRTSAPAWRRSSVPSLPAGLHILSNGDITCLCLNATGEEMRNSLTFNGCNRPSGSQLRSYGMQKGSFAMDIDRQIGEFCNKNGVLESSPTGRGTRATGGWVSDGPLTRRVGLSVSSAPCVAECPALLPGPAVSAFSDRSSFLSALISYQFMDKTCLCLKTICEFFPKLLEYSQLDKCSSGHLGSYAIGKGSFGIKCLPQLREF